MENLSNSDVTTKYQEAAKIANLALQGVIQQSVAGARVNDLCKFGDTVIEQVNDSGVRTEDEKLYPRVNTAHLPVFVFVRH